MKHINNILFVAGPEPERHWALERANAFASSMQARLTMLMIAERIPSVNGLTQEQVEEAIQRECEALMDASLATLDHPDGITRLVRLGRPHIEIIREVLRGGYDLVIKAAEGQGGLRERLLGSRDMHLLRKSPCPVWLLKPEGNKPYRRLLAAVDFEPGVDDEETAGLNRGILDWASSLALAEFAELHIAHAWDALAVGMLRQWGSGVWAMDTGQEEYRYLDETRNQHLFGLESLSRSLRERLGSAGFDYLAVKTHLPRGPAIEVIPALASELEADLIVIGTVGRGGIPGLLIGNTAETILGHCDCAVLALKPPSFVSPVTLED